MPQVQDHDNLSLYDYHLPNELIAQEPVSPRDASRLLVVHRKTGTWEHRTFRDLPQYLDANDLMVANNTRVLRARLLGQRVRTENGQKVLGGKVEFVLLEEVAPLTWEGLFHASAKYVPGLSFEVPIPEGRDGSGAERSREPLRGTLVKGASESPSGTVVVQFDRDPVASGAGEIPLPHYIDRSAQGSDDNNYQTLYAKHLGSAAAPTAGLHFTDQTMQDLRTRGVSWKEITLHVGVGTFRPVKYEDISKHVMHEERFEISPEVADSITSWKASGKRILAVGTTSVRTLESAWGTADGGKLQSGMARTSIFIRPGTGFHFQVVDRLLTNFHLPKSTLVMLVSSFAGRELTLAAYEDAVRQKYRFFSYGDAMLIL